MRECWNWQTGRLEVPVSNHRRVGSSPISRTMKNSSFVYRTKEEFFNEIRPCGRVKSAARVKSPAAVKSRCAG